MRRFKMLTPMFIVFILCISGAKTTKETPKPKDVELTGKIVCLAEAMHKQYKVELSAEHEHLYGVKTKDDKYFTLLRTSLSEALFVDRRLHEKDLIIKGRVFPNTHLLEVIRIQSLIDGIVHELYYYCDTCYIRAVAPGNCDCCQAPVELIEKPLNVDSVIPSP